MFIGLFKNKSHVKFSNYYARTRFNTYNPVQAEKDTQLFVFIKLENFVSLYITYDF